MIDKIYDDIKKRTNESANKYCKEFGIIEENQEITDTIPKKNQDLGLILSKLKLIELNEENLDKINEFHEYVLKVGIDMGVGHGKQKIIESIKKNHITSEKLFEINPQDYVNYELKPSFLNDLKESLNEK